DSASQSVQVTVPNGPPTAVFTVDCTLLDCTFDSSGSADDGTIVSRSWDLGDGATSTDTVVHHTYAGPGTYPVSLTVTDNEGSSTTQTTAVAVTDSAPSVAFRAKAVSFNDNTVSASVVVPVSVQAGDQLLLFASDNTPSNTRSGPSGLSGWTQV